MFADVAGLYQKFCSDVVWRENVPRDTWDRDEPRSPVDSVRMSANCTVYVFPRQRRYRTKIGIDLRGDGSGMNVMTPCLASSIESWNGTLVKDECLNPRHSDFQALWACHRATRPGVLRFSIDGCAVRGVQARQLENE